MPFTLAHPAAIVCLKNKRFNFTALVLGSMAPDFLYFINFRPYGHLGHEFLGFLILNLPICFLLAYVFHNVVKAPLISHLPRPLDSWYGYLRTEKFTLTSFKDVLVFSYSALLGMLTHIVWDAFTHKTGFFVNHIGFLQKKMITIGGYDVYGYKLVQHISTLIGLIIVLIALYLLKDKRKRILWGHRSFKEKFIYDISIIIISIVVLVLSYLVFSFCGITYGIGALVISIINGVFIGSIILGFIYR